MAWVCDGTSNYKIWGWMVGTGEGFLELRGCELNVYAYLYSFANASKSRGKEDFFPLYLGQIGAYTGYTVKGITKALKSLVDKGLIEKKTIIESMNQKKVYFRNLYWPDEEPMEQSSRGRELSILPREHSSVGVGNSVPTPREHSSVGVGNSVSINKNNNKDKDKNKNKNIIISSDDDNLAEIYRFWNTNIQPLAPKLSELIKDLYDEVGNVALTEAMNTAIENNARAFKYIETCARNNYNGTMYRKSSKGSLSIEGAAAKARALAESMRRKKDGQI